MNDELFESLKNLRSIISKERGIPPFLIYNDATINDLIKTMPKTLEELEKIKYFSKSKITKYGSSILRIINATKQ